MGLIAGCFSVRPALADPMTGGNPPYEDCAPPCGVSCYVPPPRCPWYFQADAVALRRDPYGNTPFATLGPLMSDRCRAFDFGIGSPVQRRRAIPVRPYLRRLAVFDGRLVFLDRQLGFAGRARNSIANPCGREICFRLFPISATRALPDFDYNNLVSIRTSSRLQNGELNVKYLLPMPGNGFRASFLVGVRYVSVQEDFSIRANLPRRADRQSISTRGRTNDLIGPQIGGYFEFFSVPNSWITFEMKGAILRKHRQQDHRPIRHCGACASNDRVITAFVGDLELMFNWQITSHCITRFGYQAMWVDGLALASRNFGPAGTAFDRPGRLRASTPTATSSITVRISAWKLRGRGTWGRLPPCPRALKIPAGWQFAPRRLLAAFRRRSGGSVSRRFFGGGFFLVGRLEKPVVVNRQRMQARATRC